jgi:hypothetical protein
VIVASQRATASRRFLAHLVRTAASSSPDESHAGSPQIDWIAVLALARRERVAPLLHIGCTEGRFGDSIPPVLRIGFESAYYRSLIGNIAAAKIGQRVRSAMQSNRIAAAPVGAWSLYRSPLRYYGDLGCRHIDDVELVIRDSDRGRAESVLFDLGFRRVRRHVANVRDAWTCAFRSDDAGSHRIVRLRWGWEGFAGRANTVAMTGDDFLEAFCDTTVSGEYRSTRVGDLFVAAIRAARPGRSRWVWLGDVHRIVSAAPLDWQEVVSCARRWRLRGPLYVSLAAARELLETPIPAEVLTGIAPGPIRRELLHRSLAACETRGATRRTVQTARALLGESWWDVARGAVREANSVTAAKTRWSAHGRNRFGEARS